MITEKSSRIWTHVLFDIKRWSVKEIQIINREWTYWTVQNIKIKKWRKKNKRNSLYI